MKLAFSASAVLSAASVTTVAAQNIDRPRLRVSPLAEAIVLDGRMREPVWATADSGVLTEYEPELGIIPPERTVVKVLANADVLVVGIRCDDPQPERLTSFSRARHAYPSAEAHVAMLPPPGRAPVRSGRFAWGGGLTGGGGRWTFCGATVVTLAAESTADAENASFTRD